MKLKNLKSAAIQNAFNDTQIVRNNYDTQLNDLQQMKTFEEPEQLS